jgi:hypothetical protein
MLREWERKHPGRVETIFNALANAAPSHLLDRRLHDFNHSAPDDAGPAAMPIAFASRASRRPPFKDVP